MEGSRLTLERSSELYNFTHGATGESAYPTRDQVDEALEKFCKTCNLHNLNPGKLAPCHYQIDGIELGLRLIGTKLVATVEGSTMPFEEFLRDYLGIVVNPRPQIRTQEFGKVYKKNHSEMCQLNAVSFEIDEAILYKSNP
eukprot:TRINITY_DN8023_c0_g1_i3.p1 TRINITY_DN8023_c0_g1~~TRINITY_DN8023_c0_g1_i3.p1  ORF type:complete len:141 (+),score=26.20 TRINITY_DN8023_c0_g1_i3:317-739(+)